MGNLGKTIVAGGIATVVVAVIILVGLIVTEEFSISVRTPTTANSSTTSVATVIINESVRVGTSGQYPYLQTLTGCVNGTNGSIGLTTNEYTISEGYNTGGYIYLTNATWNNTAINCSAVSYLANSDGSAVGDNFVTGLSLVGTFIGVLILAIIGAAIIGLFKKEKD